VANYNVDIAVVIKGNEKLTKFKNTTKALSIEIQQVNKALKVLQLGGSGAVRSFNSLNNVLADAKANFNAVASGTLLQQKAARQLVSAEKELNREYQQRERLLENIRRNQSGFAQFSRSASQISGSTTFDTATQKSIDRNRRNQNRIAGRSPVPFGPQQFIGPLPMQGPMYGPMQGPMPMMTVNNNPRILRNLAASQAGRGGTGFGGFSESIRGGGFFPAKKLDAVTKSINRYAKKIEKSTARMATHLQSRGIVPNATAYASPIGPQPARPSLGGFLNRMGFGSRANPQGPFANSRGRAGRISGSVSSGLIGGGFPLLFGQGPLAAAGGGIGGLAGGALGGGFGFGLSIAGTAIAARIQETIDFQKAVDKLNVSIRATGGTSTFTAKQVKEFAQALGLSKDEALEALKAFQQFEASARITLTKFFGSETIFDTFAGLKDNASIISALPKFSKELSLEQAKIALETLKTNGASAAELKLREQIFNKNTEILKQQREQDDYFGRSKDISTADLLNPFRGFELGKEGNIFQRFLNSTTKSVEELRKARSNEFFNSDEFKQQLEDAKERLKIQKEFNEELERQAIIKAPVDELKKLLDPLRQIDSLSKSIGNSFAESFKGIISGSMSAQEALRNLFQRTADAFLDMAAQILAAQIRSGIMGLFSSFLNPLNSAKLGAQATAMTGIPSGADLPKGSFGISSITRAAGGSVKGGNSYIVGERGPELFSPGVSGMITPNHALGGSTNIVVNVDASGSNVEGDENQGRELGRLISAAVQSEIIQQQRPGGLLG
tara:strand:- start:473 stop:2827 length:2355 start_codon:yes stop_codon:yes gene_type:complete